MMRKLRFCLIHHFVLSVIAILFFGCDAAQEQEHGSELLGTWTLTFSDESVNVTSKNDQLLIDHTRPSEGSLFLTDPHGKETTFEYLRYVRRYMGESKSVALLASKQPIVTHEFQQRRYLVEGPWLMLAPDYPPHAHEILVEVPDEYGFQVLHDEVLITDEKIPTLTADRVELEGGYLLNGTLRAATQQVSAGESATVSRVEENIPGPFTYTFQSDGTFSGTAGGTQRDGTWSLEDNRLEMIFNSENDLSGIVEIEANRFTYTLEYDYCELAVSLNSNLFPDQEACLADLTMIAGAEQGSIASLEKKTVLQYERFSSSKMK